jgi:hypothetical protein
MIDPSLLQHLTDDERRELDALLSQPSEQEELLPKLEAWARDLGLDTDPAWVAALHDYGAAVAAAKAAGVPPSEWHARRWGWIIDGQFREEPPGDVSTYCAAGFWRYPALVKAEERLLDRLSRAAGIDTPPPISFKAGGRW